ncbi:hypothetical protein NIIDNTM18_42840 [Mycolicibacterium litorale]|uniref:Uncharacterized protein n=1 Tax=Mycolicibacterium litorale TaxID=758802 RepID=A0A6S6PAJ0_9MYCO|nr:hypothetical protein [Mycolicibacterium litorale]BCI55006.1 hypothetical protein NIIDNTM18_42840 [Mycolicibacterium litorale]
MNSRFITTLLDNATILTAQVGEWALRQMQPARDSLVREAEQVSREALREVLVAKEAEEEVAEPDVRSLTVRDVAIGTALATGVPVEDVLARLEKIESRHPYCNGCGSTHAPEQTCLRWASESGIPASGADASPPVDGGAIPPRISPAGGPQLSETITEVLAGHMFSHGDTFESRGYCTCGECPWDWREWRVHVAPLIAQALQAQ